MARYVCVHRAVMRRGREMDSERAGVLERGAEIVALEEIVMAGTARVRFALDGECWVSKATGSGVVVLEELGADAVLPAAEEGVPPTAAQPKPEAEACRWRDRRTARGRAGRAAAVV